VFGVGNGGPQVGTHSLVAARWHCSTNSDNAQEVNKRCTAVSERTLARSATRMCANRRWDGKYGRQEGIEVQFRPRKRGFLATSRSSPVCARFDQFEIDLVSGELRLPGVPSIRIQPLPLQVLRLLLEAEGRVVTRDQLRSALWSDGTFVDFEHGVNTAIKKLRQALGDSYENPRFIETLPKTGYRFLVPVQWITTPDEKFRPGALDAETPVRIEFGSPKAPTLVVAALLVACAAASYLLYRSLHLNLKRPEPLLNLAVTSVGEKYGPSLSPDGRQLAYAWNGGSGKNFSIYVKLIGNEESLRLTHKEAIDFNPVWSPDGRYLAFCRIQKGQTGLYLASALGGAERKLRDTHWTEREFYEVFWYFGRLSWSPDGKTLAFSDRPANDDPTSLFLLSLDTLAVRKLTSPSLPGDYNPAFSPDGRTLAFNRGSQGITSIYTMSAEGGEERRLISGSQYGWGLAWTADGRNIVFGRAGWLTSVSWLWRISARGGEPERLQFGQEGGEPSIRGNRLVYARQLVNMNVWKRTLESSRSVTAGEKFLVSTTIESGPQFSPDGSKIVFESTRTGAYEVWLCRSDGSNPIQLTHLNTVTGTPRWSPDGEQIAFDSVASGNAEIFVMDSRGGSMRQLTGESSTDFVPSWSRDGHWIYFVSDRSGDWQMWKMPSAGGVAVQLTHGGGYGGFESADAKFLYYAKGNNIPGIWRVPTSGGEEIEVVPSLEAGYWGYWALVQDGIYYLDVSEPPGIALYSFATRRSSRVFDLESRPVLYIPGLGVSPDGKAILYTQIEAFSRDIVLVENYR
jgi:Tol biopolymer transport system component/DNA-binding winged helix-turn-helix (wHTH) protein